MNKWHATIPSTITQPPTVIRRAKLDHIALVPAQLVTLQGEIPTACKFPSYWWVLHVPGTQRQQQTMKMVTSFFRNHGRQVITLPMEKITKRMKTPRPFACSYYWNEAW